MNKGAYEVIKLLIQNVDPKIELMFVDGMKRTIPVDPEKLLAELDEDQRLEKEANWLAQELAKFCSRADCDKCEYVGQQWEENTFCKVLSLGVNSPDTWREAARKAVEEECKSN